jgi:hypothetical protein
MKRDTSAAWSRLPQRLYAAQAPGMMSRRHLLVAAGAMTGAAIWDGRPAFARQATPVASPIALTRDWRGERWVGTWAAAMHTPSAGFGEEFPSQFFEFDRVLTFSGSPSITIPPGALVVSNPGLRT